VNEFAAGFVAGGPDLALDRRQVPQRLTQRRADDVPAKALSAVDDAFVPELSEGLSDRHAAGPMRLGELRLGWEQVAGRDLAARDQPAQLGGDVQVSQIPRHR
jgi:hypothetical protein